MKISITLILIAIVNFNLYSGVTLKKYIFRGGNKDDEKIYKMLPTKMKTFRKYPADKSFRAEMIVLANDKAAYAFWMRGKIDGKGNWLTSPGLLTPSKANWYQNGFYELRAGKYSTNRLPAATGDFKEGESGSFTIAWSLPEGKIKLRVTLPDNEDKILLESSVTGTAKIRNYTIRLLTYPSSFAGGAKRGEKARKREIITATRSFLPPKSVKLTENEPWVLFRDNFFCVENRSGEGPCAVACNPEETIYSQVVLTNYYARVFLTYPVDKKSHIILWDFNKMTNKNATEYMKSLTVETK
jgi:hypothetical protein